MISCCSPAFLNTERIITLKNKNFKWYLIIYELYNSAWQLKYNCGRLCIFIFSTTDTEGSVAVDNKSSNEVDSSEARDNDTSNQRQTEGEYLKLTLCCFF